MTAVIQPREASPEAKKIGNAGMIHDPLHAGRLKPAHYLTRRRFPTASIATDVEATEVSSNLAGCSDSDVHDMAP